jgi:hypothetical protein
MTGRVANLIPDALRVLIDPGHFVVQNRYLSALNDAALEQALRQEARAFSEGQLDALQQVQGMSTAKPFKEHIAEMTPKLEERIALDVAVPVNAPRQDGLLRWGINVPYYGGLALGAGTIIGNEQEKQAILQRQRLMASRNYPMY